MEYNAPKEWKTGKEYERTLLGCFLSLSCVSEMNSPSQFFNNPSSTSKQEHDITERNIWQVSSAPTWVYEHMSR